MKLLLFDIDLTLVNTGGSGRSAMTLAFEKLFGMKNGLERVNFAGRTDALIFKDALRHQGLQWTPEKEDKFKKAYFEYLKSEIKKPNARKHIEPGISALLDLLSHQPDITLGLLTGNWRRGGRIKLEYFKLLHYFQIGAFADDSEMREKLPAIACRRFEQKFQKKIQPHQVFIIGDTPLDVACAKPFGAKSVAVATGFFSYAELNAAKPDYLFADLSDSQEFLQIFNDRN